MERVSVQRLSGLGCGVRGVGPAGRRSTAAETRPSGSPLLGAAVCSTISQNAGSLHAKTTSVLRSCPSPASLVWERLGAGQWDAGPSRLASLQAPASREASVSLGVPTHHFSLSFVARPPGMPCWTIVHTPVNWKPLREPVTEASVTEGGPVGRSSPSAWPAGPLLTPHCSFKGPTRLPHIYCFVQSLRIMEGSHCSLLSTICGQWFLFIVLKCIANSSS